MPSWRIIIITLDKEPMHERFYAFLKDIKLKYNSKKKVFTNKNICL